MGKVLAHVHLTDGLAEQSVGQAQGSLPAGLALFLSAQCAAIEVKCGLAELVAQVIG